GCSSTGTLLADDSAAVPESAAPYAGMTGSCSRVVSTGADGSMIETSIVGVGGGGGTSFWVAGCVAGSTTARSCTRSAGTPAMGDRVGAGASGDGELTGFDRAGAVMLGDGALTGSTTGVAASAGVSRCIGVKGAGKLSMPGTWTGPRAMAAPKTSGGSWRMIS